MTAAIERKTQIDVAEMEADAIDEKGKRAVLVDKLARYYHSGYVAKNRSYLLQIPFAEWLDRQLRAKGVEIDD